MRRDRRKNRCLSVAGQTLAGVRVKLRLRSALFRGQGRYRAGLRNHDYRLCK